MVFCSVWKASLKPTGGVKTTPQMTLFRDGKVCKKLAADELTIAEYSLTTSTKVNNKIQKEKNSTLGIAYVW